MKPFNALALGFVILLLSVEAGGVDLLADPVGWALVLVGVQVLPADYPLRTPLRYAAGVALVVSLPLWVPAVGDAVADAEPAVGWAVSLPTVVATWLVARAVATAARDAGELNRSTSYRLVEIGAVLVGVLPVGLFALGLDFLAAPAGVLVLAVPLMLLVLLFLHSDRTWAGAPVSATSTPERP